MLKYLRYRYAKNRMAAYINGELSVTTRRFVARMIDSDERCYQEYVSQRQKKQELERDLPRFGQADKQQLSTMWAAIQAEMNTPSPATLRPTKRPVTYRLALIVTVLLLVLPFVWSNASPATAVLPQQPSPELLSTQTAPSLLRLTAPTLVALVTLNDHQATDAARPDLQNTPAPHTPAQ